MAVLDMTEKNFLQNNSIDVFTFSKPTVCIDIMKEVKGLDFKSFIIQLLLKLMMFS